MTPNSDPVNFWKDISLSFWDHFWTCFAVYVPMVTAFFWYLWYTDRKLWHWFILVPTGILLLVLLSLPIVVLLAAGNIKYGWDFPEVFSDSWTEILTFLDQTAFPSPKIWHLIAGLILFVFLVLLAKLIKSKSGKHQKNSKEIDSTKILESSSPGVTDLTDQSVQTYPSKEKNESELSQTVSKSVTQRVHLGVIWKQETDGSITPICPKKNCSYKMQMVKEDAIQKGMILTASDRSPRNVVFQCSNPGCRLKVSANKTKNDVNREVGAIFNQD